MNKDISISSGYQSDLFDKIVYQQDSEASSSNKNFEGGSVSKQSDLLAKLMSALQLSDEIPTGIIE